jgi:hypothetical protein
MNAAPRVVTVGETFSATLVNDLNPLHHAAADGAQ